MYILAKYEIYMSNVKLYNSDMQNRYLELNELSRPSLTACCVLARTAPSLCTGNPGDTRRPT